MRDSERSTFHVPRSTIGNLGRGTWNGTSPSECLGHPKLDLPGSQVTHRVDHPNHQAVGTL